MADGSASLPLVGARHRSNCSAYWFDWGSEPVKAPSREGVKLPAPELRAPGANRHVRWVGRAIADPAHANELPETNTAVRRPKHPHPVSFIG